MSSLPQPDLAYAPSQPETFAAPAAELQSMKKEVAQHLPLMKELSTQLKQTALQVEQAVVGVCANFAQISEQARRGVSRATAFLSNKKNDSAAPATIQDLIRQTRNTFDGLLTSVDNSSEISSKAVQRMQEIDFNAKQIAESLEQLNQIAIGYRILALNARIEAAHAGQFGKGFEIVAAEVVAQAALSQKVITQVGQNILELRSSASYALADLESMSKRGRESAEVERKNVDQTLQAFNDTDAEMRAMLMQASDDSTKLSKEIGGAVSAMQFQDRVSQRLDHVVKALDATQERLSSVCGDVSATDTSFMEAIMSKYTMKEERQVNTADIEEADGGEIELF